MNLTEEQKKKLNAELDKWIDSHRDEYIRDVTAVCKIRSVSSTPVGDKPFGEGCYEMLMTAFQLAESYGFRTKNYDNYCGSAIYGDNPNGDSIGIIGHMDIVPEGTGWTHDPFDPYVSEDGKYIFGRGTADNKAPALVGLYAMRFLKEHDIHLTNDVMMVFGLSEETGMQDMPAFLEREKAPKWSLVPDAKYPLGHAEKGFVRSKFASYEVGDELIDIYGGDVVNSVPDKAYAVVSGCTVEEVRAKLAGMENIAVEADPKGVRFLAKGTSSHCARPYGAINANDVLVKALLRSEAVHGKTRDALAFISTLTEDYDGVPLGIQCEDDISGKLTCVFSWIRKEGKKILIQPDIRYPVKADQKFLMETTPKALVAAGFEVLRLENSPAFYFPLEHPVVQKLIEVPREVLGMPNIPPLVLDGGTYARKLPNAVSFGVTVPDRVRLFGFEKGGAHQADEYGDIPNLMKGIKIFVRTLIEIDDIVAAL